MKNQMELEKLGLIELNTTEKTTIEGGSFWAAFFAVVAAVAAIIAVLTNDK
jgi:hypothetical protein